MIDHSDRWWPAYTSNAVYAGRDLYVPATASIRPRERRMSSAAELSGPAERHSLAGESPSDR